MYIWLVLQPFCVVTGHLLSSSLIVVVQADYLYGNVTQAQASYLFTFLHLISSGLTSCTLSSTACTRTCTCMTMRMYERTMLDPDQRTHPPLHCVYNLFTPLCCVFYHPPCRCCTHNLACHDLHVPTQAQSVCNRDSKKMKKKREGHSGFGTGVVL